MKRKIVFIIFGLSGGGAERVVANLSNVYYRKSDYYLITGKRTDMDYAIESGVRRLCLLTGRLMHDVWEVHRFLKKNKIDVAVGIDLYANWCVCIANFFLKTKIVISERNAPKQNMISNRSRLLIKLTYWNADFYVFQTQEAKKCYPASFQNKSCIIHNPVKEGLPYRDEHPKKELVAVGRLSPQKNYPMLIEAFAIIHEKYSEYSLHIYGKGKEEGSIRKMIRDKGLETSVIMHGFCKDIHEKIRSSAIYVMSSDFEGMPNALMEAMAMGFPVVCTDCPVGGPRELIQHGVNGLLVPVGDAEFFAESVMRIIENENFSRALSKNAKFMRKSHSIQRINRKWDEVLLPKE